MKKHLASAIAAATLMTAGSLTFADAPEGLDANVYLGEGTYKYDVLSLDDSGRHEAYGGSIAYTDKSGFGGQFDLDYQKNEMDDSNIELKPYDKTLHAYYRNAQWLAGVLIQDRKYRSDNGNISHHDYTSDYRAVEAQGYFNDFTVYGQYGTEKWDTDAYTVNPDGDLWSLEGRYFIQDNLRLDARVEKDDLDFDGNDNLKTTTIKFGAEYRLTNSPVSFYGGMSRSVLDDGDDDLKIKTLEIGVKLHFGSDSLKKRDRNGTSLSPVTGTPGIFLGSA